MINDWIPSGQYGQMVCMDNKHDIKNLSLQDLDTCTTAELRYLYESVFGQTLQKQVSRDFLTGNIAWELQAKQRKQNPATLRRKMLTRARPAVRQKTKQYQPGTRLVREWHGETYEVVITDQGYRWQDRHFRSLTAIARDITGANWSGPRFFGLTGARSE